MGGRHALESSVAAYVYHNDDPNVTRPGTFGAVVWIGSVQPNNMEDGDFWEDPTDSGESVEAYVRTDGTTPFTTPQSGVAPTDAAHLATRGYILGDGVTGLRQIVTFTADGSFVKADYPWLRAVRVRCQGGGGGGAGGASTPSGEGSAAAGGQGGNYAESLIEAASIGASTSVTVGSGGSGGTGIGGSAGGTSSFGGLVSANGGAGGFRRVSQSGLHGQLPPDKNETATGDIVVIGDVAEPGIIINNAVTSGVFGGNGGSSMLGTGGNGDANAGFRDTNGKSFGGGGGGHSTGSNSVERTGGDGAPGIVIVELYG